MPVASTGGASLRLAAVAEGSARSLLAVNLGTKPETLSVRFPPSAKGAGEISTWGGDRYAWSGRSSDAFAWPNLGMATRPLAVAESLIVVPARSVAVVRRGAFPKAPGRLLHASWRPGRLQPSDTLEIEASVAASGRTWTGGTWTAGDRKGTLPSFDGAWDGTREAAIVRIPASALPRGRGIEVRLRFSLSDGDPLVVPVKVDNEDVPRAVKILDDFDDTTKPASNGRWWWTYGHGSNGSRMDLTREDDGKGRHLVGAFHIVQPPAQTFPNFALAGLDLRATDYPEWSKFRGLVFDIKTRHNGNAHRFLLQALTTTVTDYDDFQAELPDTKGSWTRVWLRWDELRQAGWGKDRGAFDPANIKALQFRADGEGDGTLELENLAFWGTEGDAVPLVDPPRPTRGRGR